MKDYFLKLADVLSEIDYNKVIQVGSLIKNAGTVYVIGNGGSLATAEHFICDINKAIGTQAISLASLPTFTAYCNDDGYENALTKQLKNQAKKDDLLICISTSGNSPNIVNAAKFAQYHGVWVVGLVAFDGGNLPNWCDVLYHADTDIIEIAEDAHMAFCHAVVKQVK